MREAPDGLCPSGAFIASRYGRAAGVPTARYGKTALAFAKAVFGGDKGDRTPDLMTASHALSQLSYAPELGTMISILGGTRNVNKNF